MKWIMWGKCSFQCWSFFGGFHCVKGVFRLRRCYVFEEKPPTMGHGLVNKFLTLCYRKNEGFLPHVKGDIPLWGCLFREKLSPFRFPPFDLLSFCGDVRSVPHRGRYDRWSNCHIHLFPFLVFQVSHGRQFFDGGKIVRNGLVFCAEQNDEGHF